MGYTPRYFNGILLQQTLLIFMNHFLKQIAYFYQLCEINMVDSSKINSLVKDLQVNKIIFRIQVLLLQMPLKQKFLS